MSTSSQGKLVGSRGAMFRKTSTSKPDDWKDHSGKDVGAARNYAHEKTAVAKAEASKAKKEQDIINRTKAAAQRAKETLRMAKEEISEAKGKWIPDRPMKVHVAAMDKRDTADLKGMHDRWSGDHRDKKSDPSTSERLLAVHHVLKKRGESVPDLPQHRNLGRTSYVKEESSGTEARVKIKNVARPDDAEPTSEKSKLSKQAEIKTKIVEERPTMSKIDFGLSSSLINATKSIMEKKHAKEAKTDIDLDPETNDKLDDENGDDDDDVKKESKKHTSPKSHKEKKLAALAHPKDKITHKDVLVGRGVLKKEETELDIDSLTEEQLEEVLKKSDPAGKWISDFVHSKNPKFEGKSKKERMKQALGAYYAKQRNEEVEQIDELKKSTLASYTKKAVKDVADRSHTLGRSPNMLSKDAAYMDMVQKYHDKTEKRKGMIGKAVDKLAKEESEQLDEVAKWRKGPEGKSWKSNPMRDPDDDEGAKAVYGSSKLPNVPAHKATGSVTRDTYAKLGSRKAVKKLKYRPGVGVGPKGKLPEEFEFTAEEIERIESIASQLDEAKPTIVSAPIRGANQDQSGFGVKKNTADYTISDSKKVRKEEVDDDSAVASRSTTRGKVVKAKSGDYIATNHEGSTKTFSNKMKADKHASSGMKEEVEELDESTLKDKITDKDGNRYELHLNVKGVSGHKDDHIIVQTHKNGKAIRKSDFGMLRSGGGNRYVSKDKSYIMKKFNSLKEDIELSTEKLELEEGRGRPKKSGGEAEGDDTHKHPIQQLTKIAHAIEGSEPHFEHKDGAKTKVGKHLAKHITAVYGSMRTSQEKDDFANKLHASKDSMKSAVSKLF